MNIAIIGAGIYGCHMALSLKNDANHIDLYDRAPDLFAGASTHNSHRIHKGYHYPRSGMTREMCQKDEAEFVKTYPQLISPDKDNPKIFCVADNSRTLIDYKTMELIMRGSNLLIEVLSKRELADLGFTNIEGGFKVYESILLVDKAKSWFKKELIEKGVSLKLHTPVVTFESVSQNQVKIRDNIYDFVINCTYNQAFQHKPVAHETYFDLCFSLVVSSISRKDKMRHFGFGIFDGDFPSLEPFGYDLLPPEYAAYENHRLFQVYHVRHTSVKKYKDINEARKALETGLSTDHLQAITKNILEDVLHFYPTFNEDFRILGHNLSLKTKVTDLSDARPLLVLQDHSRHPRFIQVFSSKLTSIISAGIMVKKLISTRW